MNTPTKNCEFCEKPQTFRHRSTSGRFNVFTMCGCLFGALFSATRVEQAMEEIRLPAEGPVHVSVDGDGALMITVPLGEHPGENTERCDQVARLLMNAPPQAETMEGLPAFCVETGEARFLTKQIRGRVWDKVVIVNYMADASTQTRDIPGPFLFALRQAEPFLTLVPMKVTA